MAAANVMALLMVVGAVGTVHAQTASVTATWDRNTDSYTAGYIVQYGTTSGSYQWSYDAGNAVSAQLTLNQGAVYYFAVRAYTSSAQMGPASTEASVNLNTTPATPTAQITATLQGTNALLTWSTGNATTAAINGTAVGLSGSATVPVSATTTFTLVAASSAGATVSSSATVTVAPAPAPTASISASLQNGNAVVTWQSANASSVTINGVTVAASGTQTVPVTATTTFTLVASNAAGQSVTHTATVTVAPVAAPTASLTATLQNGNTAVLTWTSANATSVTINGTAVGLNGTHSIPVSATTTFTLVASNAAGQTVTRTATVTVPVVAAPTASLTATLQNGNTAVLTWTSANATAVTINGTAVGLNGTQSIPVSATTTFTLVAGNAAGQTVTRTATVTVAVVAAPTASLTATLQNGNTAVLTWTSANATAVTLNAASVALSGTQSVPVSTTTTFTLVARNSAGMTVTQSATVTVATTSTAAPTAAISGVFRDGMAVLTWASTNGARAQINNMDVALSGTKSLPISATTIYRLLVTAANGKMIDATTTVEAPVTVGAPGAPTNMATSVKANTVRFSWAPPVTGPRPDRYLIDVGYQGSTRTLVNAHSVGNVLAVSAELPKDNYWVRIRAANSIGVSGYSNLATFTVGKRLATPQSLSVQWSGTTALLSWTAPSADGTAEDVPTAYVLEAGTAPGLSDVASVNLGNRTHFSAPIPRGTYYVRVRATNDSGQSAPTEDVVLSAPGTPGAPTRLVATGSLHTVTLRWQAPAGGEAVTYQLEAGSAPGLSDIAVAQVGNVTSFSSLIPPGNYYIRVKAVNGVGASVASNEVFVTR